MEPTILKISPGSVIDERFEIIEVLGRGGFATVYKARQFNIDRILAIKIMAVRHDRDEAEMALFEKRFFMEARSAAKIKHPNVVIIFDHGVSAGGVPFIAMELLVGHTLSHELNVHGPIEPRRALPLFARCLDGLEAAHTMGIIHKDLKPSNLFLSNVGGVAEELKIVDFGIAAMLDADNDERLTGTDQFIGTAAYCAPEYYQTKAITPGLDIYQMGLVLAEILTGEPVVKSTNALHAIGIHCQGNLQLPVKLLEGPVGPILRKALAFNVADRYASAGEMRDALGAVDVWSVPKLTAEDLHTCALVNPRPGLPRGPISLDLAGADAALMRAGAAAGTWAGATLDGAPPMGATLDSGSQLSLGGMTLNTAQSRRTLSDAQPAGPFEASDTPLPSPPSSEDFDIPPGSAKRQSAKPLSRRESVSEVIEAESKPPRKLLRWVDIGFIAVAALGVTYMLTAGVDKAADEPESPVVAKGEDKEVPPQAEKKDPQEAKTEPKPDAVKPPTPPKAPPPELEVVLEPSAKGASVAFVDKGTIEGLTLRSKDVPLPWTLRLKAARHKDFLLKIQRDSQEPAVLLVSYGQEHAAQVMWTEPVKHKTNDAGSLKLPLKLERQATSNSNNKKPAFKKKWIVQ